MNFHLDHEIWHFERGKTACFGKIFSSWAKNYVYAHDAALSNQSIAVVLDACVGTYQGVDTYVNKLTC